MPRPEKGTPRYRVSTNIPIPEIHNPNKYPFKRMKPGASFGFPADEEARVRNAIGRFRKNGNKTAKFTIRGEGKDRCRVWRIA